MAKKWRDVRGDKKPREAVVVIPNDDDDAAALEDAESRIRLAEERLAKEPGNAKYLEDRDEAKNDAAAERTAIDENCTEFHLRALPNETFEALVEQHPPTKDQKDKWRKENPQLASLGGGLRWNDETFRPALIAACCIDPEMDDVDAKDFCSGAEGYTEADVEHVYQTAININTRRRSIDPKGSRKTSS